MKILKTITETIFSKLGRRYYTVEDVKKDFSEEILKQFYDWLMFHLPDRESGWTLEQCLDEIERMFKEET